MNRTKIGLIGLVLLCGSALVYAQEPEAPKQEEPRKEEPRAPRQDEAKPQKPDKQERPESRQEESKPSREDKNNKGQQEKGEAAQAGHARPSGKSAHIPDGKFKTSFGRQHAFIARQTITQTTVVAGQTQFVYGGYTFVILDPWPSAWLFTDDCYIDYVDDDYFLFDLSHPGIRIALFVAG